MAADEETVMECTASRRGQARPTPESGVAGWIALRRAHEGGVANLAGQWLDSGRRVPGYVADALDRLTSAGLLALGEVDPESCGVRRVTVTDTGSAQYVALCQIHHPSGRPAVRTPRRWARSLPDQRSHLLAERGPDQLGVLVAVCGRRLPWSVGTSAQPTGCRCLTCEALAAGPLGEREQRTQDQHRGVADPDQVVINPWGQLTATSVDPVSGPGLQLVTSLVLQRARGGGRPG